MARPTSSAGSSRPFTASGDRPNTAVSYGYDANTFHYAYGPDDTLEEEDEEEEDESEDEDVFAYLPPSTADQQSDATLAAQQQQQPQAHYPTLAHDPTADAQHVTLPTLSPDPAAPSPAILSPSSAAPLIQSNNPYAFASTSPPHPPVAGAPYFSPSVTVPSAVDTPPSTGSHASLATADGYRMRRISAPPQSTDGNTLPSSRGLSLARNKQPGEVRVSLPPGTALTTDDLDIESGSIITEDDKRPMSLQTRTNSPSMSAFGPSREGSIKMEFDFDNIEEEDSPFPEVRASVSNVDDPEMPTLTLRMWVIGLLLLLLASGLNVYLNFRQPAPTVVPLALLLFAYPLGKFAALVVPIYTVRLPRPFRTIEFSLNPGPWSIKEHVLVYIMANVSVNAPYALNAVVVSEINYNVHLSFGFTLVFILATQLTGFGLAGLCREFLVRPASMVWPSNLVVCTLLNTLHAEEDEGQGGTSRFRFFLMVMGGAFCWMFLPALLFTAVSAFSWICWMAPNNVVVNQLFGVESGLGMSIITFDWTQISWIGSPLMIPWWAQVHIATGFVLFFWILLPILYYTNTWELGHFPMSGDVPYDRFGAVYNVSRVINANGEFNDDGYASYSQLYLPGTYTMTYLLAFMVSTAIIVHTILFHGRQIVHGFRRQRLEKDDIHAKLMRNYPEVPAWWYATVFVVFFCLAIVAVEVWHTQVPVWALLLALLIPIVYVLPSGFVFAMTGQGIAVNLLVQVIPGVLLPGKPLANMIFKAYAVQTLSEAQTFTQDLKLGHYIKVPPRATFTVQLVGTVLAAICQAGVKTWLFHTVPDMCTPNQESQLTCPHNQVYYTASAIWGLIGPARQFGVGSVYHVQVFALIIGAILPIPAWLWVRRNPKNSWGRYLNVPVMLNGMQFIPPAGGINYSSWFVVGFIFQYLIRKRNFAWWSKFNYVTSAALDSGTVVSIIFIFFALQLPRPKGYPALNWWGNEVWKNTADARGQALHPLSTAAPLPL